MNDFNSKADEYIRRTIADLERRQTAGAADVHQPWVLQGIFNPEDARDSFVYTVGLSWLGWPELLVRSPDLESAAYLLNTAAARHLGRPFEPDETVEFDPATQLAVPLRIRGPLKHAQADEDVPDEWAHVGIAVIAAHYRGVPLSVLQCVWPDDAGHWPGEDGYNEERFPQPLLPVVGS